MLKIILIFIVFLLIRLFTYEFFHTFISKHHLLFINKLTLFSYMFIELSFKIL